MYEEADSPIAELDPAEAEQVSDILMTYAREEILIWRTAEDIRAHAADFLVARDGGRVVGCVALRDYGGGLEEVRSLAVHPDWKGRGLGKALIDAALAFARDRCADLVFALTRIPEFFERQGFHRVPKSAFPEKVWKDCELCPRRERCDEHAVCRQA